MQQSEKQIESLTNQIDTLNDNIRRNENQISNQNRELMNRNDELEHLQSNLKIAKETNLNLEKEIRDKENLVKFFKNFYIIL